MHKALTANILISSGFKACFLFRTVRLCGCVSLMFLVSHCVVAVAFLKLQMQAYD